MLAKPQNWWPGVNRLHPRGATLVGAWLLNEGAGITARDVSGNGHDGILTAMEAEDWVGSPLGGAIKVDSSGSEYVDLGTFTTDSPYLTLIIGCKPNAAGSDKRVFSKADGTAAGDHDLMMNARSTGNLRTRINISGTLQTDITTGSQFVVGKWGIYGVTFDGKNVRHFKNSVVIGTFAHAGVLQISGSTKTVAIGRNGSDSTAANSWDGDVDFVIWDARAYPPDEMAVAMADPFAPFRIPAIARRHVAAVGDPEGSLIGGKLIRGGLLRRGRLVA